MGSVFERSSRVKGPQISPITRIPPMKIREISVIRGPHHKNTSTCAHNFVTAHVKVNEELKYPRRQITVSPITNDEDNDSFIQLIC